MENVRNRIRLEFFENNNTKMIIKQQPKITFNGIYNHMKIVIAIHSNKTMFLWIDRFTWDWLFYN